jgi:hypothetical protein
MAKTQWAGPLRTGKTTGIPDQNTVGTLIAYQECTVSTASLTNRLQFPADCRPVGFNVVVTGSAGQVPGVNVFVGTTADQSKYCTFQVSATGFYGAPARASTSGAAIAAGFGGSDYNVVAIEASAQASASALIGFEAIIGIHYSQRS